MAEMEVEQEPLELLATRRSRRSTAGNRMQVALAEMAIEDIKDPEDDNEFNMDKDEQDLFESDFESTDEEEVGEGAETAAAEKVVHEEDRRERQAARSRLEKATAAAHARNKATFNPQLHDSSPPAASQKPKAKRHTVNFLAEGGTDPVDFVDGDEVWNEFGMKRKSQRATTVLKSTATVKRLKETAQNRSLAPKKAKAKKKVLTQAELIAKALDNEEGNIIEHRDYLRNEERKRKRAKVVKQRVTGPVLRWISRVEEVPVPVIAEIQVHGPDPAFIIPSSSSRLGFVHSEAALASTSTIPPSNLNGPLSPPQITTERPPAQPPLEPSLEPQTYVEKVAKNYLIHDLGRREGGGSRRPTWNDSMQAMFGNHVKWDEIKVWVSKGRPTSRPAPVCCLTGDPAKYMDPRTGAPYAHAEGYKTLTEVYEHQHDWDPESACYNGY